MDKEIAEGVVARKPASGSGTAIEKVAVSKSHVAPDFSQYTLDEVITLITEDEPGAATSRLRQEVLRSVSPALKQGVGMLRREHGKRLRSPWEAVFSLGLSILKEHPETQRLASVRRDFEETASLITYALYSNLRHEYVTVDPVAGMARASDRVNVSYSSASREVADEIAQAIGVSRRTVLVVAASLAFATAPAGVREDVVEVCENESSNFVAWMKGQADSMSKLMKVS